MKASDRLFDSIANLVSEVTTDIRQRVVEEPWFGHPVTHSAPNYYEGFWERYGTPDQWRSAEREPPAELEISQQTPQEIDR